MLDFRRLDTTNFCLNEPRDDTKANTKREVLDSLGGTAPSAINYEQLQGKNKHASAVAIHGFVVGAITRRIHWQGSTARVFRDGRLAGIRLGVITSD